MAEDKPFSPSKEIALPLYFSVKIVQRNKQHERQKASAGNLFIPAF